MKTTEFTYSSWIPRMSLEERQILRILLLFSFRERRFHSLSVMQVCYCMFQVLDHESWMHLFLLAQQRRFNQFSFQSWKTVLCSSHLSVRSFLVCKFIQLPPLSTIHVLDEGLLCSLSRLHFPWRWHWKGIYFLLLHKSRVNYSQVVRAFLTIRPLLLPSLLVMSWWCIFIHSWFLL
jgi:hypothetical protein